MKKKALIAYSNVLGGLLIIFWGILHALIIPEIHLELKEIAHDGIISLITLSYLGIIVLISSSGLLVIVAALLGIKNGEQWAFYYIIIQGFIFTFVSLLLIILQPMISIMGIPGDFILLLAIIIDVSIAALLIFPLILFYKEFF